MKKLAFILTLILLLLFILVIKEEKKEELPQSVKTSYETKSIEQDDVAIEVKPISLEADKEIIFQVSLDTHSVELNYDLIKETDLLDDRGKAFKPKSWDGGSGGHHLSGKLIFPQLGKDVKLIKLKILEREFIWTK